jgi:hypothetical protein
VSVCTLVKSLQPQNESSLELMADDLTQVVQMYQISCGGTNTLLNFVLEYQGKIAKYL